MKRTFNYTGRRKIGRKDVSITLRQEKSVWVFDAGLRLADYNFSRNAEVWVEAHRQNLWMQWSSGTVSSLRVPVDRRLVEFDVPDGLLFRVRVVQPPGQEHHKLLGEADGIPFVKAGEADDRRRHLLVPVPDALGQQLWKLDFEHDPPQLLVNNEAKPSWKEMARSPQFIALVYPEVLRRMLSHALVDESWTEDDEEGGWPADWVRFAKNLGGLGPVPPLELRTDRDNWVEEAVAAFCRRLEIRSTWDRTCDEEGGR
ncbi:MAG TPA: hypothetical protein VN784_04130 [Candidatus Limnocylindrales bacterium]|nr:hypothetical protein [Candidatus Limnocylindrales bacterium]